MMQRTKPGLTEITKRGNKLAKLFECENSSVHYLSILEGNTCGCVYVNKPSAPTLAVIFSYRLGGFQLMGKPLTSPDEYASFRLAFQLDIIPRLLVPNGINEVSYSADSDELMEMMRIAFFDKEMYEQEQRVYIFDCNFDLTGSVTTDFLCVKADKAFSDKNPCFMNSFSNELSLSYQPVQKFFTHSLAYIALDKSKGGEAKIIGNIISGGHYKNQFVLGADTDESYRQRGVCSSLLFLAARDAKESRFNLVWECATDNVPSVKTVEKCGFKLKSTFPVRWFEL